MKLVVVLLVASLAAIHAYAQDKPSRDPADPRAAAAPLKYESAFARFRGLREDEPAPWKQVNEEVAEAGHAMHGESSIPPQPDGSKERGSAPAKAPAAEARIPPAHHH